MTKSVKRKTKIKKKNEPLDKILYNKIKKEAKKRFKVWPSAYASGWVVKEYKRRGGRYSGKKSIRRGGIDRWFQEKWVRIGKGGKLVPCGRSRSTRPMKASA